MEIKTVRVGMLETNVYILNNEGNALIIDPGDEVEKIVNALGDLNLIGIIVTHHHFDHVGALEDLAKMKNVKVYDYHNLKEGKNKIGNFEFMVIRTPGHKEDSISIYFEEEKMLFCGDFIFRGSIGRWDFPGGDMEAMKKSINKILEYPEEMKIYPGHGDTTTLKDEKENLKKYINYF